MLKQSPFLNCARLTSSFFDLSNPEKYLSDFVEKALGTARVLDSPMPTTTHHLLPEHNCPSEDNNAENPFEDNNAVNPSENKNAADDEIRPVSVHDNPTPPKERFHISGHVTIYTRFAVISLLIPAFVILIMPGIPETLAVEILSMICVVRNALVLLFHFISLCFRARIEFLGRSPSLPVRKGHPHWFTRR